MRHQSGREYSPVGLEAYRLAILRDRRVELALVAQGIAETDIAMLFSRIPQDRLPALDNCRYMTFFMLRYAWKPGGTDQDLRFVQIRQSPELGRIATNSEYDRAAVAGDGKNACRADESAQGLDLLAGVEIPYLEGPILAQSSRDGEPAIGHETEAYDTVVMLGQTTDFPPGFELPDSDDAIVTTGKDETAVGGDGHADQYAWTPVESCNSLPVSRSHIRTVPS